MLLTGAPDYTVASGGIINDYTSGLMFIDHILLFHQALFVDSVGVDGTVDLLVVGGGVVEDLTLLLAVVLVV